MTAKRNKKSIKKIKSSLVDAAITFSLVYLLIVVPLSLFSITSISFSTVLLAEFIIVSFLFSMYVGKKRLSLRRKAIALTLLFFSLATVSIHLFGLSIAGLLLFYLSSMFMRLGSNIFQATVVSALATSICLLYMSAMYFYGFSFSVEQSAYEQNPVIWSITLLAYFSFNFISLNVIQQLSKWVNKKDEIRAKTLRSRKHQLHYSDSILNEVVNNLPFSIVWKDPNLFIKGANQRFLDEHNQANLLKLKRKSDIGIFGIKGAEARYRIERSLLNKTFLRHNYQESSVNENGETIHKEVRHVLMQDAEKNTIGILIAENDITELIELKKSILLDSKDEDKLKLLQSRFLANVSHEIRTPLNGIQGTLQILESTRLSDEQTRYMHNVSSSVFILDLILSDLLDLSKIEAGELRMERLPFDIDEVITGLVNVYQVAAVRKGIRLTVKRTNDIKDVLVGDSKRLLQVLRNVLSNAIKFTHEGEVTFTVNIMQQHMSVFATFCISDTGIGFNIDRRESLFSPFTQIDGKKTRRYGGNGLGLPITKSLVDMMHGKIDVTSEINRGSQFNISIPFSTSKKKTDLRQHPGTQLAAKKLRILLVEDNEINQEIALAMLNKINFHITLANNGKQAVEWLEKNECDIVLMDIQMPVMDGVLATSKIRQRYTSEQLPIIAVTANVMDSDIKHYLEKGFNSHVGKPYDQEKILSAVRQVAVENIDRRVEHFFE
jgi:signal transduction histidine kinase/ActR/RegA family two-component response regulator